MGQGELSRTKPAELGFIPLECSPHPLPLPNYFLSLIFAGCLILRYLHFVVHFPRAFLTKKKKNVVPFKYTGKWNVSSYFFWIGLYLWWVLFCFLNCFLTGLGKNKLKVSYFLTTFSVRSSHKPSIKSECGVNFKMAEETIELCTLVAFPLCSFPSGDVL